MTGRAVGSSLRLLMALAVVAAVELGLELVELVLELVDGAVDGGESVGSGHLAAHVVAVAFEDDLAVEVVREREPGDLGSVFCGRVADDVHCRAEAPLRRDRSSWSVFMLKT